MRYAVMNSCCVHNSFQIREIEGSHLSPYQGMRLMQVKEVPATRRVLPFGWLVFARPTEGYLDKVKEARGLRFVPGIHMCPNLSSLGHFVASEN